MPGFQTVADTDDGELDGDTKYDDAIGPMQFMPATWRAYGVDADGNGVADPQNMFDAAASAAGYLCATGQDLSTPAGQQAAVLTYNHSQSYVDLVLSLMHKYMAGQPAGDLVVSGHPVAGSPVQVPVGQYTTAPADPRLHRPVDHPVADAATGDPAADDATAGGDQPAGDPPAGTQHAAAGHDATTTPPTTRPPTSTPPPTTKPPTDATTTPPTTTPPPTTPPAHPVPLPPSAPGAVSLRVDATGNVEVSWGAASKHDPASPVHGYSVRVNGTLVSSARSLAVTITADRFSKATNLIEVRAFTAGLKAGPAVLGTVLSATPAIDLASTPGRADVSLPATSKPTAFHLTDAHGVTRTAAAVKSAASIPVASLTGPFRVWAEVPRRRRRRDNPGRTVGRPGDGAGRNAGRAEQGHDGRQGRCRPDSWSRPASASAGSSLPAVLTVMPCRPPSAPASTRAT